MTRNCKTIAQNHLSQSKLVFGLHDISCVMRFEAAKAARSARASDSSCFHCFESIKTDAHAQSPKNRWSMNDFWVNFVDNFANTFGENFGKKIEENYKDIIRANFGQYCKKFRENLRG